MKKLNSYPFSQLYKMSSGVSTVPEQAGHGAPFVSFSTIFNNPVMPEELPDLMDTSVEEQEKCSVKKGDILITRTSETKDELAMSSVALKDYPHATFSGFAKRLRPLQRDITYDKFMAYYLRSPYFRKVVDAKVIMTLRASFNEKIFSYIDLELPEYDEQVVIGDFFYTIEEKIRTNNKIVCEIRKLLTLFYDYWFTQFDFPNEEGKPYRQSGGEMVHNDDLDWDIPVGWEVKKLGSIIEENDKSPVQVGQAEAAPGEFPFFTSGEKILPYEKSLVDGPFCYLNTGGLADVKFFSGPAAYSTDVWSIYGKDDLTYWLYMFLESIKPQMFQRFFEGSGLKHLQKKRLSSLKVCIPPEDIRKKFNEIAAPILKEQSDIYFENQRLAQLRDYLLPLLMSGQVIVNTKDEEND